MTRLHVTGCLIMFLSFTHSQPAGQVSVGPQQTYVNTIHRWSISYPDGWQLDATYPDQVIIKPPPSLPRGLLGIHALPSPWGGGSLEDIADNVLREWGQGLQAEGQTYRTISRQRVTLANDSPAFETINTIGVGVLGRCRQTIVVRGERVFLIDAEAEDSSWSMLGPRFDQIVNSFTIH